MKQDRFFAQSYQDSQSDYLASCRSLVMDRWDTIVLTAANEFQAEAFRLQIKKRERRLPQNTKIVVIPDYKNERVGSGGATLNVLRYLLDEVGQEELLKQKILMIHSGGDSKRIPQYSACGKLFSPVLHMLPGGYISTIFDELLMAASGIPAKVGKGIMVFPSDTMILFNPLQLDLLSCDAAGLSVKAPVKEGPDHGVYLSGNDAYDHRNRNVSKFLHKQPEEVLRIFGAVDAKDQVDIDSGCTWLGSGIVTALVNLITTEGKTDPVKFERFVNPKACLNFYTDFVYPLAQDGTLKEFLEEAPENGFTDELMECRRVLWDTLHGFTLSLVKMVPAKFIHFGMTHETYDLWVKEIDNYRYLNWEKRLVTNASTGRVVNSLVSEDLVLPDEVYIENCVIGAGASVGEGCVLSEVDLMEGTVPAGTVLHGLVLMDGRYVCRIYGREDNPKAKGEDSFLTGSVLELARKAGLKEEDIWDDDGRSIWDARLYPACASMKEAVEMALALPAIMEGRASESLKKAYREAERYSLHSSFYQADVARMLARQDGISHQVRLDLFYTQLRQGVELRKAIESLCRKDSVVAGTYLEDIRIKAEEAEFPENMRLYLALAEICRQYGVSRKGVNYGIMEDTAYRAIEAAIEAATASHFPPGWRKARLAEDMVRVELPVRVNFCGGPSDAAPYCLEHGGTMLDGALTLNGKYPVKAEAYRIEEAGIRIESADQGLSCLFTDLEQISACRNPSEPFTLHKAVLLSTGLIPFRNEDITMKEYLAAIGGGFCLKTMADVPKGSGLGTSSILAAAAIKAIHLLMGREPSDEMVYAQVFLAEQLMSTGGGWQDQVGGYTPGIKYFTAQPGVYQKVEVENIKLSPAVEKELNDRFALIFSGQRRLARNVLREQMNQCIRNEPDTLEVINTIQGYCSIMRYYLEKGNLTEFGHFISKEFELVKKLDAGVTNTCIDYIFDVIEDLIDGKFVCGAGGGGFLQVILKQGVTKDQLRRRINDAFVDCGVEVWDSAFVY